MASQDQSPSAGAARGTKASRSPKDHVILLEETFGPVAESHARSHKISGYERTLRKRWGLTRKVTVGATPSKSHYGIRISSGDDTVLKFLLSREAMEAIVDLYDQLNPTKRERTALWSLVYEATSNIAGGRKRADVGSEAVQPDTSGLEGSEKEDE